MRSAAEYLAVDLGAESGRAMLGRFDGERVVLEEVHRFPNVPVRLPDGLHWDALRLMGCVYRGLSKASREARGLESVGVDAWGVDFGLFDRDGSLVSNPYHYRDGRTEGMIEAALARASREEIYGSTGIQFIRINTLYQLLAMRGSPLLDVAQDLLLMPDVINYWLTGAKAIEHTNATTTQLYDPRAGDWAGDLMGKLDVPRRLFGDVVAPGTELGTLLPEVGKEAGLERLPVTAVASHDTASAVVAVPAGGEDFAYISSGTWSLVGLELPEPNLSDGALEANFTNEGGFGGRTRFLKNVMGLWILQECKREWERGGRAYSYERLIRLAEEAPPLRHHIDPDDPSFLEPDDMPNRVSRFCEASGQGPVEEPGAVVRCVLESNALAYRQVLEGAEDITGRTVRDVHVVGGGSQNELLCRLTAEATGRRVLAGPVEATALGNVLVQAYGRGRIGSLEEMREVARASAEPRAYEPQEGEAGWTEAYERFCSLRERE